MNSISFPKMFSKNTTKLVSDEKAVSQNLLNLLKSEQGELKDDPYFGVNLKKYLFDPNDTILEDILVDEIYTQIAVFMPQLKITRKDITIVHDRTTIYATVKALNMLNYTTSMYNLVLFQEEDK